MKVDGGKFKIMGKIDKKWIKCYKIYYLKIELYLKYRRIVLVISTVSLKMTTHSQSFTTHKKPDDSPVVRLHSFGEKVPFFWFPGQ